MSCTVALRGAKREDYGCRRKAELDTESGKREAGKEKRTFWKTAGALSKSRVAKKWLSRCSGLTLVQALATASHEGANCLADGELEQAPVSLELTCKEHTCAWSRVR